MGLLPWHLLQQLTSQGKVLSPVVIQKFDARQHPCTKLAGIKFLSPNTPSVHANILKHFAELSTVVPLHCVSCILMVLPYGFQHLLRYHTACSPQRRSLKQLQALALAAAEAGGEAVQGSPAGKAPAAGGKPAAAGKAAPKVCSG